MSAVSTYGSTGRDLRILEDSAALAPVIDLATERRRRQVRDADLQRAIARHPAGTAFGAASFGAASFGATSFGAASSGVASPRTVPTAYRLVVPLYAKIAGWVLALALVAGLGGVLGTAFRPGPYVGETYTHTVAAGESLWGLAEGLGSSRELGIVVEDIRSLNGLDSATLHPGQEVILPLE